MTLKEPVINFQNAVIFVCALVYVFMVLKMLSLCCLFSFWKNVIYSETNK